MANTPYEDIQRFNKFIDKMDEDELDLFYEADATDPQRELIDRHISREEITEEEASEEVTKSESRESLMQKFVSAFRGLFK